MPKRRTKPKTPYKRKNSRNGKRLRIRKPNKALVSMYKPLADILISLVLSNESRTDNKGKRNFIQMRFKLNTKPSWFPRGRMVERNEEDEVREFDAEMLLMVLWERYLAPYNPGMLYSARLKFVQSMTRFENKIDNMFDIEQDDAYNEQSSDE